MSNRNVPEDIDRLAAPRVRQLKPYEPGKPIETLERELGITHSIKLASNENPLGASPHAVHAVQQAANCLAIYPDGNGFALKTALSAHHDLPPSCITLGNGSNDVLELIARAFLTPGDEVVISAHAFAVYALAAQAVGALVRVAKAYPADHVMPYGHDPAALAHYINPRTRLIFLANPNNPTGTWIDKGALRAFIEGLPGHVLVVVDEAYCEYVREPDYPDTSRWLKDFANLIVTRTFSKVYGLAGLRVGYGLSHPQVADLLNRVRQPFNVNSLAQVAAQGALKDQAHVRRSVEVNTAGLLHLKKALGLQGLAVIPSVANFVLVDLRRDARPVYQALLREGVIVRPVASYGLPQHLRITVGTQAQNARVINALERVLKP